MQCVTRWFALFLFCWSIDAIAAEYRTADHDQDSISIALGKSIFESGIGRDGRAIGATLHGIPLSGAAIACSGCHGKDASGGGEAFIVAPDIRWSSLGKPFPSRRAGGAGKSYDMISFAKAIRSGHASDGRQLDPAMPRIDLAADEVSSLIAYLSVIEQQTGSLQKRPHIISLLPESGHNKYADALSMKLNDCASSHIGIPIAAIDTLYFSTPIDAVEQLENRIQNTENPLILMPFIMGWEEKYVNFIRSTNTPTVLPFTFLDPPLSDDRLFEKNWYFYFPGLQSQLLALMNSIHGEGYRQLGIIYNPADELSVQLNNVVLRVAERLNMSIITSLQKNDKRNLKSAVMWLMPTHINHSYNLPEFDSGTLMLVPVFFFTQDTNSKNSDIESRFTWRVSYPYKPVTNEGQWISPIDAWTSASCSFLANLNNKASINNDGIPAHLEWGNGFELNGRLDPEPLSDTVFIRDYD